MHTLRTDRAPSRLAVAILVGTLAVGVAATAEGAPERGELSPGPVGEIRTLPGVPAIYRSVAVSSTGAIVAAGDKDGLIRVWKVAEDVTPLRELRGKMINVDSVALSPDGRRVAASGPSRSKIDDDPHSPSKGMTFFEGSVLEVWDVETGQRLATIEPTGIPYGLAFDTGGATIAAVFSGDMAGLSLWQADGGRLIRTMGGPGKLTRGLFFRGPEIPLAFDRDLGRVAALELLRPNTIRLWSTEAGRVDDLVLEADLPLVDCCALSPNGRSLAVVDADQTLTIWSLETRSIRRVDKRPTLSSNPGRTPLGLDANRRPLILAYDPADERVVAGVADGTIRIYDSKTAELREVVRGPDSPVRALAFTSGRICVIAGGWSIPINGVLKPSALVVWQAGPPPSP